MTDNKKVLCLKIPGVALSPCFSMLTSFRSLDFNTQKSQHRNIGLRILEGGLCLSKLPCSEDSGVNIIEIDGHLAWGIILYLFRS